MHLRVFDILAKNAKTILNAYFGLGRITVISKHTIQIQI